MQVSVRLAALPIPEYLDFHSGYSAPRSQNSRNIFQNIFLFQNIPKQTRPKRSRRLFVYVIAWARGQLRINFTRIFKVFKL